MTSENLSPVALQPDAAQARSDRLYALLPAIYRMRDAGQNYPLRALLRVIAEQVNLLEDDIAQLYENWFIETAEDWVVPYLGELVGVSAPPASLSEQGGSALSRILTPRREIANTVRYRRRKGSLALLELLAHDTAQWPARAQEFYRLLQWQQNLNHQHPERARSMDVRNMRALDELGGAFDSSAYSVDVRRISSHRSQGLMNPAAIGLFVWRLQSFPVSQCPAYCHEKTGPHCYTFNVLGADTQLYIHPQRETDPNRIAGEMNTPSAIRREALERDLAAFYGEDKSFAIWARGWAGFDPDQPVPITCLMVADLSDWQYVPPQKHIAIDPVLGRIAFPPNQLPKKGVKVSYHYAFSSAIGGGEYRRDVFDPAPRKEAEGWQEPLFLYVGKGQTHTRIADALQVWRDQGARDTVIQICDSGVYTEPVSLDLAPKQSLQIRAASGARPVLRLLDWQTDLPDAFSVNLQSGSRLVLDGLLILGCSVHVNGIGREDAEQDCMAELVLRHTTLVPGWGLEANCDPKRPAEPSLELYNLHAKVKIEHAILGSIQIQADEVQTDPLPLQISDSIIDASAPFKEAIGAVDASPAFCLLDIARCTVFGITNIHALQAAQDVIFSDCLNVARRQLGCMRFCYVKPGCRTPRRYHCQPDLAFAKLDPDLSPSAMAAAREREALRLIPQFTSERYGQAGYAQLGTHCAQEIKTGAEDGSEMGVFHDLYQPQREANLLRRLQEFCVAEMQAGIIFVN